MQRGGIEVFEGAQALLLTDDQSFADEFRDEGIEPIAGIVVGNRFHRPREREQRRETTVGRHPRDGRCTAQHRIARQGIEARRWDGRDIHRAHTHGADQLSPFERADHAD